MMKQSKHNIPAFTIMELVIVMMIATLVTGMAYYTLVQGQVLLNRKQDSNTLYQDVAQLHTLLKRDFGEANQVWYSDRHLSLQSTEQSIEYYFGDSAFVVRTALRRDTFFMPCQELMIYCESEVCEEGPVNKLILPVSVGRDTLHLSYYKELTLKDLMENGAEEDL